ncbi:hypothetical protein L484_018756 [Morus notabilis]|uniref:Uncharacterized protein n=1 Tax=Morus notabilis TaxID=981085 RepID=W9RGQ2_9ROSA|nr:hypothetical protein L484_018756 [Morus notabilis]
MIGPNLTSEKQKLGLREISPSPVSFASPHLHVHSRTNLATRVAKVSFKTQENNTVGPQKQANDLKPKVCTRRQYNVWA